MINALSLTKLGIDGKDLKDRLFPRLSLVRYHLVSTYPSQLWLTEFQPGPCSKMMRSKHS